MVKEKAKTSESISLEKKDQKKFAKKSESIKKQVASGDISIKEKKGKKQLKAESRGLIYVGHIPHGFYEEEMRKYFKQFGDVTNVMVCRSSKTGKCKGYGFVEFLHPEVAKIAAETMNNYVMFKRRLVSYFVPFAKRPPFLFSRKTPAKTYARNGIKTPLEKRRKKQINYLNRQIDDNTYKKQTKRQLSHLDKKLQRLKKIGIDIDLQIDVPKEIVKEIGTKIKTKSPTKVPDSLDSDIEYKVPVEDIKKEKYKTPSKTPKKVHIEDTTEFKTPKKLSKVSKRVSTPFKKVNKKTEITKKASLDILNTNDNSLVNIKKGRKSIAAISTEKIADTLFPNMEKSPKIAKTKRKSLGGFTVTSTEESNKMFTPKVEKTPKVSTRKSLSSKDIITPGPQENLTPKFKKTPRKSISKVSPKSGKADLPKILEDSPNPKSKTPRKSISKISKKETPRKSISMKSPKVK